MASFRTTVDEVKNIFDTSLSTNQLEACIRSANIVVNNNLLDVGMNSDTLRDIERWLAAHFAETRDPVLTEEKIGDATDKYLRPKTKTGLAGTTSGQQALLLDYSGKLASLGKRRMLVDTAFVVPNA